MKKNDAGALTLQLNGETILPGTHRLLAFPIGNLPSGNPIEVPVHVFHADLPGPCLLLMAGMHGDEINSIEILRRLLISRDLENLERGSVIVVPLLNIYGFINFSRDLPDGKDVNRSFPGSSRGSLASRVAHFVVKELLPAVDMIIDLHTGGANRHNHPQVRYAPRISGIRELAETFAAPFLVEKGMIRKSLRKIATERGIPTIVFEGGESERYHPQSIRAGLDGIRRVLHYHGMMTSLPLPAESTRIQKTSWVRAQMAGMFLWHHASGEWVEKGQKLGDIHDPQAEQHHAVLAPRDGYIIGHNNAAVVSLGDALFHLGW